MNGGDWSHCRIRGRAAVGRADPAPDAALASCPAWPTTAGACAGRSHCVGRGQVLAFSLSTQPHGVDRLAAKLCQGRGHKLMVMTLWQS